MASVAISPLPKMQFNQGGIPLAGGKLFTYQSGTATKLATYTSATGVTPNSNPIILDANGQCDLWLQNGLNYTIVLSPSTDTDPPTNSFWTVDSISTGNPAIIPPSTSVSLTIPTDYADLQTALDAVSGWVIPDTSNVTINLPTGQTSLSVPIKQNNPYGARIKVLGATPITTTATASGVVAGAAGAWSVPLPLASVVGMAVNDYMLIRNVVGTGQYKLFSGMCKITSIVGAIVTVTNTAQNVAWPTAALTAADITVLKTRFVFTGCDGFQINSPLGSMDQIAIIGNQTIGTIGVITNRMAEGSKQNGYVFLGSSVGVSTFGDGCVYAQYGGVIDAQYLCVANSLTYNALAQHGGHLYMNNGISSGGVSSGGTGAGIAASNSGAVSAENAISCGNATFGLWALSGGVILSVSVYSWSNLIANAYATWGGEIRGQSMNCQYSGVDGVKAVSGGNIVCPSLVTSNNTGVGSYSEGGYITCSPGTSSSNGTFGYYADGGFINAVSATAASNGINGFTAVHNGTILASGATGTGNVTYSFSANSYGFIRATGAVGDTAYTDSFGCIDMTGMTGTATKNYGADGVLIDTTAANGSLFLASLSNIAIGATNTAAVNIERAANAYSRWARVGILKALLGIDDGATLIAEAATGDTALRAEQAMWFAAGGGNERGFIDANGNAALGKKSLATNATDGFFYIPSCAGIPTGAPTAKTGRVPIVADSSGNKIYAYLGGSWVALN